MSFCFKASKLFESLVGPLLFVLFLVVVIGVPLGFYFDQKKHNELMQQCMDDGNKEYACESMLANCKRGSLLVTPVNQLPK